MTRDAKEVESAFDLVSTACWNIKEADQCWKCPMRYQCLDGTYGTTSVVDIADLTSKFTWDEFLEYADKCLPSDELHSWSTPFTFAASSAGMFCRISSEAVHRRFLPEPS